MTSTVFQHRPLSMLESTQGESSKWGLLQIYNLYRLGLLAILILLDNFYVGFLNLGADIPALFVSVTLAYGLFAGICLLSIKFRYPNFTTQVSIQLLFDIAVLILLIHASGGLSSGLGILIIVVIAASSILTVSLMTFFFAAAAFIGLFLEQFLMGSLYLDQANAYFHLGILGASYFATAMICQNLSSRIRNSDEQANQCPR